MFKQEKNVGSVERAICDLGGLALLGLGARRRSWAGALIAAGGAALVYRGLSGHCPAYSRFGINRALSRGGRIKVERAVTIMRPAEEVYGFFRSLENLPQVFKHVTTITEESDTRSHWEVKEAGIHLGWDAEIVAEEAPRRLAWRSMPGGDIETEGQVEFHEAPGQRGTELRVRMTFSPPGGAAVSSVLAPYLRRLTRAQLGQELGRLKQLLETGEIATGQRTRTGSQEESGRAGERSLEGGRLGLEGSMGIGQQGTRDEALASRRGAPAQEDIRAEIPEPAGTTGLGGNAVRTPDPVMMGGRGTHGERNP